MKRNQKRRGAAWLDTGLANQLVVVPVSTNPEPENSVWRLYFDRPVLKSHTSGPEAAHFLEMQGRMLRVRLQQFKGFVGLLTDLSRKCVVVGPKIRRSVMDQIFVDFPAA